MRSADDTRKDDPSMPLRMIAVTALCSLLLVATGCEPYSDPTSTSQPTGPVADEHNI